MKSEASRAAACIASFGFSCRKERENTSLLPRPCPSTTSISIRFRILANSSSEVSFFRSFSKRWSSSITFVSVVRLITCCLIVASCSSTLRLIVERT